MMAEPLRYRMKVSGDDEALRALWVDHSGWGVELDLRDSLMLRGSLGEAPVAVAEDASGQLVGQLAFLPARVSIEGESVRAARIFAAILSKSARHGRIDVASHPMAQLYRLGARQLAADGYALVYGIPSPSWLPLLRASGIFQTHGFPLWTLPHDRRASARLPERFTATSLESWDTGLDRLLRPGAGGGCYVQRPAEELRRRARTLGLRVTAVHEDGVLIGLALHGRNTIADVLTRDADDLLEATLIAARDATLAALDQQAGGKLKILATRALEPALRRIGFAPDNYQYPLVVHALDASLPADVVAPQHWYLTALD